MGGAASEVGRRDPGRRSSSRRSSIRSASAGRRSATPFGPRPACASRRARSSGWPASVRTGRRSLSRSGPAAGRAAAPSTRTRSSRRPHGVAFRPARVDRLLGADLSTAEQQAPAGARRDRDRAAPRPATRIAVAAAPMPLDGRRRRRRGGGRRPSRPGGATSRSRPTSPRRSPASAATRRPGAPAAHPDAALAALAARGLRHVVRETLAGAGLTEVVTYALVSPRMVERFAAVRRLARRRRGPRRRPPGHRHEPAVEPAFGAPPEPRRQPARGRLDQPPPGPRGRRDLRGRQGLRDRDGDAPHEWWRLGIALTGAAEPPPGTARRGRPTSTTPRASSSCSPSAWACRPPTYVALADEPILHPGRAARVVCRRRRSSGRVGELHPALLEALELRAERGRRRRAVDRRAGRRPAERCRAADAAALPGRRA